MEFNVILKGFEQDLFRIKNTDMYKQARNTTEFKFIAEKGKALTHTEFYPSDADMSYIATHLRKFMQNSNVISIKYIKDNIIDKLPIDSKRKRNSFIKYMIYLITFYMAIQYFL